MSKIKVGDKVVVVNAGNTSATYRELAEELSLNNWKHGGLPPAKAVGVVEQILPHPRHRYWGPIAVVRINNQDFLMDIKGLNKQKKKWKQRPQKRQKSDACIYYKDGSRYHIKNVQRTSLKGGWFTIEYSTKEIEEGVVTTAVSHVGIGIVDKVVIKTPSGVDTHYFH